MYIFKKNKINDAFLVPGHSILSVLSGLGQEYDIVIVLLFHTNCASTLRDA